MNHVGSCSLDQARLPSLVGCTSSLACHLPLGVSTAKPQGIFGAVRAFGLSHLQPGRAPLPASTVVLDFPNDTVQLLMLW